MYDAIAVAKQGLALHNASVTLSKEPVLKTDAEKSLEQIGNVALPDSVMDKLRSVAGAPKPAVRAVAAQPQPAAAVPEVD